MNVNINGEPREIEVHHLGALISHYKLDPAGVVVELNGTIAPREAWDKTPLNVGDQVEIVSFVGGG